MRNTKWQNSTRIWWQCVKSSNNVISEEFPQSAKNCYLKSVLHYHAFLLKHWVGRGCTKPPKFIHLRPITKVIHRVCRTLLTKIKDVKSTKKRHIKKPASQLSVVTQTHICVCRVGKKSSDCFKGYSRVIFIYIWIWNKNVLIYIYQNNTKAVTFKCLALARGKLVHREVEQRSIALALFCHSR